MTPAIPGLIESQTAFPGVDFEMRAELFRPDGNDEIPGILLMHDVYGVTEHMKSVGRRIAAEGYAVLIPDMYSRGDGPAPGWPPKREEIAQVGGYPDQRGGADVRAAIKWLQSQPGVRADHVGAMGFSFGARYILLAFKGSQPNGGGPLLPHHHLSGAHRIPASPALDVRAVHNLS